MTTEAYQPELGQMCFGQPWQRFPASDMLDAALRYISHELERVLWNRTQREVENPFNNSGANFDTEGLSIHSYSWDKDEEQPWNLKCGDVEVSWYKHSWRGLSVNREMSNDDVAAFLDRVLAVLKKCDMDHDYYGKNGEQRFIYNGEEFGESSFQRACREEREAKGKGTAQGIETAPARRVRARWRSHAPKSR